MVPNDESVYNTTNPYFKNPHVPPVAENEAEFIMVKYKFQYDSVSMFSHQVKKIKNVSSVILKCNR